MSSADQYVEIDKQKHPDHVPRRGIDTLLRKNEANYAAVGRTPAQKDDSLPISDIFWTAYKWVCRRRDLPQAMSSPDEYVEISKYKFPDHVPRAGLDTLLYEDDPIARAEYRRPVESSGLSRVGDAMWDGLKFVCRRKDLPTTTPAESAPVFPLIDRSKHSQDDIETALVYMIAEHLGMVTTRVTRADVEAVIAEALGAKK
jgi:uncharacterized short protein YbdD (DUF466 family)